MELDPAVVAAAKPNERIKLFRLSLGITALELASRIGVSRMTIWEWETGRAFPRRRRLDELASALEVPVEALMEVTEWKAQKRKLKAVLATARELIADSARVPVRAVSITISEQD